MTQLGDRPHPFDRAYLADELRPAPRRTDRPAWTHMRKQLFGPFFDVQDDWREDAQTRLLDDHMWVGDPLMDALVARFDDVGAPRVRAMFEQALEHGIATVDNPLDELVNLFAQIDRKPDWFDPVAYERGRLRLCATTDVGRMAAKAFGQFATTMDQDVSRATGSTGRIVRDPVRRVVESAKFFEEATYASAQHRDSPVFKTVIRVRIMHALVRRGLRKRWGADHFAEYGMPINNAKMSNGSDWFGMMPVVIDAWLGRPFAMSELDDIALHWGYITYLSGVQEQIIPKSGLDLLRHADHLFGHAGEPSQWRVDLAEAIIGPVEVLGGQPAMTMTLGAIRSIMGREQTHELLAGTRFASADLEACSAHFLQVATATAAEAREKDHADPAVRERQYAAAAVGDPRAIAFGHLIRDWSAATAGVDKFEFNSHDRSTSGTEFEPPRQ